MESDQILDSMILGAVEGGIREMHREVTGAEPYRGGSLLVDMFAALDEDQQRIALEAAFGERPDITDQLLGAVEDAVPVLRGEANELHKRADRDKHMDDVAASLWKQSEELEAALEAAYDG